MTGPPPSPTQSHPGTRTEADPSSWADARFAVLLAGGLAVLGALLGLVWALWSPPGPRALVISPGVLQPDETEAFVAGDGRFFAIAALVGLGAGLFVWLLRARHRGAIVALGLVVGGVGGSLLMELIGHLTGGGTFDGAKNTIIEALPLSLHTPGLLVIEPALAVLLYGVLAAFAVRDDLGRSDPVRDAVHSQRSDPSVPFAGAPQPVSTGPAPSVGAGDQPQYGGRDGDAPGVLQKGYLPPQ